MRKFCLFMLLWAVMFMVVFLFADAIQSAEVQDVRGVIANERVVNLPNDSEKWYLSIVGEDGEVQYERILAWFEKDDALRQLRKQVHFREIDSNTVIYRQRYAENVTSLPTVRLQKSKGEVIYEAAGNGLPLSAEGLYGALANSSSKAQGRGVFMPWRTNPRRKVCPDGSCPKKPDPPPEMDPAPQPIDDGGAPEMAAQSSFDMGSAGIGAGVVLLCLSVGSGLSLFVQWRRKYRQ